ncbi:MAG: hypothetical protein P1V34_12985 [Alphaproteobacteria bacterium]|nr:hypothetical protein [Alphaproteobacteria bacterium]
MLINIAVVLAVIVIGVLLWLPGIHGSRTWRAMTTPLASIIGSGFLVLGPILVAAYGMYAPAVMAMLCAGAYLYGSAIRYNIDVIEGDNAIRGNVIDVLETIASAALGFAYIISVAYYLNLFGAFAVSLTPFNSPFYAKAVTSAVYLIIVVVGWTRGFKSLEQMEYVSVSVKLAIIAGLLIGLAIFFGDKASSSELIMNPLVKSGWAGITIAFGLIVTVQGFETSRYLGAEYNSQIRATSMRWAQWVSSGIYVIYIVLLAYVFEQSTLKLTETAIVDMMRVVAPILPFLLVAAALAAQFSAAVADTSGSGGLISELSGKRITPRKAYALLTAIGLMLTWTSGVFDIISYASRAFAAYYGIQAVIAAVSAVRKKSGLRVAIYGTLAVLGIAIVLFGQSAEG